jgi:hypothetical protein
MVLAVSALCLVAGGVLVGLAFTGGGGGTLPTVTQPAAYHVAYDVSIPGAATHREVRDVQRPYEGRTLSYDANGKATQGSLTTRTGSYLWVNGAWSHITDGTHRAAGDESAVPALRGAVTRRLARVRGTATVLGRHCTVVRTRNPVGSAVQAPTSSDHTDLCLDNVTGIILREVWTLRGKLVQTRVAVELSTAAPAPSTFDPRPVGPDLGAQYSAQPGVPHDTVLPVDHLPAVPVTLHPPAGYRLDTADLENVVASSGGPQSVVVEHFLGPNQDLLDVEVGDVSATGPTVAVRLHDGRTAQMAYDLSASQLLLDVGGAHVMLVGSDPALLARAALGLTSA